MNHRRYLGDVEGKIAEDDSSWGKNPLDNSNDVLPDPLATFSLDSPQA